MTFWKKRDKSGSRRNTKVWVSRLRRFGILLTVIVAITASGFYAWKNGIVASFGTFVHEKTINITAAMGFRVGEVLVTGRKHISQEDLLARLNVDEDMPIFSVSLTEARDNLSEIPWIEDAVVSRRLPDKIVVSITERVPAALWQYQKKISVIDENGLTLTSSSVETYKNLPLVVGEDAPEHVTEIVSLLKAETSIAPNVASAVRVGGRRWDLHLKNGMTIKLPENNVELALSRLAEAQEKSGLMNGKAAAIDLRIPEKFVILPTATTGNALPESG